jgi:hypothetical protein
MAFPLLSRLCAKKNLVRLGCLLLKACIFLPLPLLSQTRAVSSVSIPFSFSTGNRTMPAGDYIVYRINEHIYSLGATNGTASQSMTVFEDSLPQAPASSKLVFRSYGGRYFIASLWFSGSRNGVQFHTGSAEKEMLAHGQNPPGVLMAVAMGAPPRR